MQFNKLIKGMRAIFQQLMNFNFKKWPFTKQNLLYFYDRENSHLE